MQYLGNTGCNPEVTPYACLIDGCILKSVCLVNFG